MLMQSDPLFCDVAFGVTLRKAFLAHTLGCTWWFIFTLIFHFSSWNLFPLDNAVEQNHVFSPPWSAPPLPGGWGGSGAPCPALWVHSSASSAPLFSRPLASCDTRRPRLLFSALPCLSVNELNLPGPLCSDIFQIKKIKILVGSWVELCHLERSVWVAFT